MPSHQVVVELEPLQRQQQRVRQPPQATPPQHCYLPLELFAEILVLAGQNLAPQHLVETVFETRVALQLNVQGAKLLDIDGGIRELLLEADDLILKFPSDECSKVLGMVALLSFELLNEAHKQLVDVLLPSDNDPLPSETQVLDKA